MLDPRPLREPVQIDRREHQLRFALEVKFAHPRDRIGDIFERLLRCFEVVPGSRAPVWLALKRFAYTVSHDLKEPLRTSSAVTELFIMRKRGDLDSESSKMLTAVVKGADRMKRLIDDIMELAQATDSSVAAMADVEMCAIVQSAIENLGQAIRESRATIIVDKLPVIRANDSAMLSLFQNMIANAIKYRADRPPEILISAALSDEDYIFSIKDNGIGIDPKYTAKIFEPFRRLHGRSQHEGSGLGLAACRRIVESLGGRIWVESRPGEDRSFFHGS